MEFLDFLKDEFFGERMTFSGKGGFIRIRDFLENIEAISYKK